jgi:hypothetical protein
MCPTDSVSVWDELVVLPGKYPDWALRVDLGSGSFSSTSSAAFRPASRSGTSSRSLRGLMRSKFLLDCCRILLATGAAQSQRHQGPGIASSDRDGTSTP